MGMYFAGRCWFLVFAGYFGGRYFFDSMPVFVAFMCVVAYFLFRLFTTKPSDVFEVKIESDQITLGRRKWSMLLIPSNREEMTGRIDFTSLFFFTKASSRTSALNILTLLKSDEEEIIQADVCVTAIGEIPTPPFKKELGLDDVRKGDVRWLHMTNIENVFVAGDVLTGPSKIGKAIYSGLRAAKSLDHWLELKVQNRQDEYDYDADKVPLPGN